MMKFIYWIVCVFAFLPTTLFTQSNVTSSNSYVTIPTYTDAELIQRISNLKSDIVPPRFDRIVKSYINTYTVKRRQKTEAMIGRSAIYFPLFEKYLRKNNLPQDLKYLSVVESALDPRAVSRSGAVGLWQFMPGTGKDYGLSISSTVDERHDPHLSTEAALTYLHRLYKKFGNWELALAAYNGGPGRVNRAVRRGRSHNFWRIKKYLPLETRNYVPAFIAATYIMHYYMQHNLSPAYPDPELQVTDNIMVYQGMSFREISAITGASVDIIKRLNPSYLKGYVPARMNGSSVILPLTAMAIFENYMGRPDTRHNGVVSSSIPAPLSPAHNPNYVKTSISVEPGQNLDHIAEFYKCTKKDIVEWNHLKSARLGVGQLLTLYLSGEFNRKRLVELAQIPHLKLEPIDGGIEAYEPSAVQPTAFIPRFKKFLKPGKKEKFIIYQVKRRESLAEIASRYPGISVEDILVINKLRDGQSIKPGTRLKIKSR